MARGNQSLMLLREVCHFFSFGSFSGRLPGELPLPGRYRHSSAESMRILVSVVTKLRRVTIDNSYLPSE